MADEDEFEIDNESDESENVDEFDIDDGDVEVTHDDDEETVKRRMDAISAEARMQLRANYRDLIAKAQNITIEEADFAEVNEGIVGVNSLMETKNVVFSSEGTYDSEALKQYSEIARHKIVKQKDEALQFNAGRNAEKMIAQMKALAPGDNADDPYPNEAQWAALGRTIAPFLQIIPTFHYLYGSFPIATEERLRQSQAQQAQAQATQEQVKRRGRQRDELAPLTQPKAVINASEVNESEETTKLVDLVWKRLKVVYEKNNKKPISYFEFVLDPQCFTQTIENMFYVSFLVKDGKVSIELDDFGLPVLRLQEEARSSSSAASDLPCNQCVMTMDKRLWRELVETFNIEKAVLSFKR